MNAWAYLLIAIAAEVIATTSLKLSKGFSVILPSVVVVTGYCVAFYFLSLALKRGLGLGTAYAVWSGIGTALIAILGVIIFKEEMNIKIVIGICMIIAGVIMLNMTGSSH